MKGIILAGGHGTRLHPLTLAVSKQLLPVYDKPMLYYPLSVLIEAGIREVAVIIKPDHLENFQRLLGFNRWGVEFHYHYQSIPLGIAHALLLAEDFIGNDSVCLILGDNIFTNPQPIVSAASWFQSYVKPGAGIFSYESAVPERYGVIEFDAGRVKSIEEKPKVPKSSYVVTGCYLYSNDVVKIAKSLKPSARGELEITDVNNAYIARGELSCEELTGTRWLDCGTPDDLHWASVCIRDAQQLKQGKIGCPTEAARRRDEREKNEA